jgi:glycosyltransferase involved in cell wall biosynthesis
MVTSVGLEQRDYRLLAGATERLDIDVKVAGFSQFFSRIAECFPKEMPENMTNKRYSLPELIELYHNADVVAVCLKENDGAAGITALLEAMACKRAIVCVRTKGLAYYLSDERAVMTIEPGDVAGLQAAILYLLNNPQEAKLRAERAYELVWAKHDLEKQVRVLTEFVRSVEVKSQEADKYLCRN